MSPLCLVAADQSLYGVGGDKAAQQPAASPSSAATVTGAGGVSDIAARTVRPSTAVTQDLAVCSLCKAPMCDLTLYVPSSF